MNTFNIGGRIFNGSNIDIVGNVVTIDGVRQGDTVSGVVEIRVLSGEIQTLRTDAAVVCGQVNGDVRAGGSVNCGDVQGSVSAGGSVNCDKVGGSVRAGGSVNVG